MAGRTRRAGSTLVVAGALTAALGAAGPASAQDPPPPPPIPPRTATFAWDKNTLRMSMSYRDVVDKDIQEKLKSGIPTVIVMKAWLFEPNATTPAAGVLAPKSCRVTFDLWDEVFKVELTQPGGNWSGVVPNVLGVMRRCADVDRMPLLERGALTVGSTYLVQGIVEVNPISPDILDRIKRWVTRPKGSATVGAGDALFGSFVGLFVAQIGAADRRLRFRTQTFVVPPPPPPPPPPPKP